MKFDGFFCINYFQISRCQHCINCIEDFGYDSTDCADRYAEKKFQRPKTLPVARKCNVKASRAPGRIAFLKTVSCFSIIGCTRSNRKSNSAFAMRWKLANNFCSFLSPALNSGSNFPYAPSLSRFSNQGVTHVVSLSLYRRRYRHPISNMLLHKLQLH